MKLKHGFGATPNPTTCDHCGYYNADWGRLRDHINHKHTKEKLYSCDKCPHTTYSVYSFRSHKSQHKREDATLREFQCGECRLSYRSQRAYMDHFKDGLHSIRHVSEETSNVKHETDDSGVDVALPPPIDFDGKDLDYAVADDANSGFKEEEADYDFLSDHEEEDEERGGLLEAVDKVTPMKDSQFYPEMSMFVEDDRMVGGESIVPVKQGPSRMEYKCRPCHFITGTHPEYRSHMIQKHGVEIGEERKVAANVHLSDQEEEESWESSAPMFTATSAVPENPLPSIKSKADLPKKPKLKSREKDLITKTFIMKQMGVRRKKEKKLDRLFHCDQCSFSDKRSVRVYTHIKKAHNTKPAKCDVCGHLAGTQQILKDHISRRHEAKTYNCDREDSTNNYVVKLRIRGPNQFYLAQSQREYPVSMADMHNVQSTLYIQ